MVAYAKSRYISEEEYLERESRAETKSEYFDGCIVAMAGASPTHNRIKDNISGELYQQLKRTPCQAFSSDQRVKAVKARQYTYPDIVVVCGAPTFERIQNLETLTNPALIVEVLSDTTEAEDRGFKFHNYQSIDSLKDYILVSQKQPLIEHYERQSDNSWRYTAIIGLDASLRLPFYDVKIGLADMYDRVTFPQPEVEAEEQQNEP